MIFKYHKNYKKNGLTQIINKENIFMKKANKIS